MKIVVMFPTASEAQWFEAPNVLKVISGVGITDTAYSTLKVIHEHQPDWIILAGIAGYFPHSNLKIGDTRLVSQEVEGDLGFYTEQGFVHLADLALDMAFERRKELCCPYLSKIGGGFETAKGLTANTALSPLPDTRGADLENMEGAAFFHVCLKENQPFIEIRTISNEVKLGHGDWDMEGAIRQLTTQLHALIDQLQAK